MDKETNRVNGVRASCKAASAVMDFVSRMICPGVTTLGINSAASQVMSKLGVRSAFLGYQGFPGSVCVSLNEEVLHGIPSSSKIVEKGDIVKVDLGVILNGYYSDMANTFLMDDGSCRATVNRSLMDATLSALMAGIAAARPGNTVGAVASAIQGVLKSRGYAPVDGMSGHGVGTRLHEPPVVPNRTEGWDCTAVLTPGMTIAIEPMVGSCDTKIRLKNDGWTIVMADCMPSAHFEHTVLITDGDPEILTI